MKAKAPGYPTAKDIQHLPTKGDVEKITTKITTKIVDEAVDTILHGMDEMVKDLATKEELGAAKEELKGEIKETRDELKKEISFVRDDIKGLEGELALTPTRKEFEKLKSQVAQIAVN